MKRNGWLKASPTSISMHSTCITLWFSPSISPCPPFPSIQNNNSSIVMLNSEFVLSRIQTIWRSQYVLQALHLPGSTHKYYELCMHFPWVFLWWFLGFFLLLISICFDIVRFVGVWHVEQGGDVLGGEGQVRLLSSWSVWACEVYWEHFSPSVRKFTSWPSCIFLLMLPDPTSILKIDLLFPL